MSSFEEEMRLKHGSEEYEETKLNIPIIKYFWQASPLSRAKKNSIHNFLSKINVFRHFSDYELWHVTQFLHMRHFSAGEIIFKEGDGSFAFYLVYSGNVDILANYNSKTSDQEVVSITSLAKSDYFGELSLLETNTLRNATSMAKDNVTLLAFFKPDLDELIEKYPVIAAKLLQAVSMIVAQRFNNIANELKIANEKIQKLERSTSKNAASDGQE